MVGLIRKGCTNRPGRGTCSCRNWSTRPWESTERGRRCRVWIRSYRAFIARDNEKRRVATRNAEHLKVNAGRAFSAFSPVTHYVWIGFLNRVPLVRFQPRAPLNPPVSLVARRFDHLRESTPGLMGFAIHPPERSVSSRHWPPSSLLSPEGMGSPMSRPIWKISPAPQCNDRPSLSRRRCHDASGNDDALQGASNGFGCDRERYVVGVVFGLRLHR